MSSKDDPGRDKPRPADAGQPKKPYATLDLKAVEVPGAETKPTDAKAADTKAADTKAGDIKSAAEIDKKIQPGTSGTTVPPVGKPTDAAASGAGMAKSDAGKPDPFKPGFGKPDASKTDPAKSDSVKSAADKAATAAAAKPASSAASPAVTVRRGGGFFSHLAAGIVGGFLALLGGEQLIQGLGIPDDLIPGQHGTAALQQRIAALESKGSTATGLQGTATAAKIADTESRLARLEEQAKGFGELTTVSSRLANETKALQEKLDQGAQDAPARIAKLEDTLSTLAAAGQNDQGGRLPQLAALTARIKELESTIANQTGAVRRDLTQALETRVTQASEAGEVARNATQRIDRDLSAVRTETATLAQRFEALKADTDRNSQTLRVVQEETGAVRSALDGMKGDVDSRLKTVARPNDVSAALAPVSAKLTELEQGLQGVVKSEADRRTNAERIVLSLELANLKRVLDRGQRFDAELAEVKKASGGKVELGALDKFKGEGVPTIVDLARDFRPVANAILDADAEPADGSVVDRLLAGAKSIVRVRKVQPTAGDKSAEAVVARMETALKDGQLGRVLDDAKTLSPRAQDAAKGWLEKVEARYSVDRALASVEGQLKSSLGGGKAQN